MKHSWSSVVAEMQISHNVKEHFHFSRSVHTVGMILLAAKVSRYSSAASFYGKTKKDTESCRNITLK